MNFLRAVDVGTAFLSSVARLGVGTKATSIGPRPEQPLVLYEFEACPFCRRVREALTELDLDADIRPCPKGGKRFRPDLVQRGGREMFPYLIDPNTGTEMYESADIVDYLYEHYGAGSVPLRMRGSVSIPTSMLASAARPGRGATARASTEPQQPLLLYSMESSPYCRIVREEMCALELPYTVRSLGKGSANRPELLERAGKIMVPYLVDPNTSREMFESADIVSYLRDQYAG